MKRRRSRSSVTRDASDTSVMVNFGRRVPLAACCQCLHGRTSRPWHPNFTCTDISGLKALRCRPREFLGSGRRKTFHTYASVDVAGLRAGRSFVLLPQAHESVAVLLPGKCRLHAPYSAALHAPYSVAFSTASVSDPALGQPAYFRWGCIKISRHADFPPTDLERPSAHARPARIGIWPDRV